MHYDDLIVTRDGYGPLFLPINNYINFYVQLVRLSLVSPMTERV